jgi:hypothetical protein
VSEGDLGPAGAASVSLSAERLTSSSLAATLRTLVAVGTLRLAFMLVTMRAAAPRSGVASISVVGRRRDDRGERGERGSCYRRHR